MRRSAFTILEITLVLTILIVVAALTIPALKELYAEIPLNAAVDMVRAHWAEARSHAILEGRPYRFAVIWHTGEFRVAPESTEFWADAEGDNEPADNDAQPLEIEKTLPDGVEFADSGE